MTDEEWNKYVERVAKTVNVPEWGMFYTPKAIIKRSDAIVREFERIEPEPEYEKHVREKVTHEIKTYKYKGKTYKKKFVNDYDRIVTQKKVKKNLTKHKENCRVIDMFVKKYQEMENE